MRYESTNGQAYTDPDVCMHCRLSTGGQHEGLCPLYDDELVTDAELKPGFSDMILDLPTISEGILRVRIVYDGPAPPPEFITGEENGNET